MLTVVDLKKHLNIDHSEDDAYIEELITVAVDAVETYLNRPVSELTDAKGEKTIITEPSKKTDYRERLLNEYTMLVIRKDRLVNHLLDLPKNTEATKMTDLMWQQVGAMEEYEQVLRKRILLIMGAEVEI